MRTTAALLLIAAMAPAGELKWDHEGYPRLIDAAREAKKSNRRILVGMSGSPT